MNIIKPEDLAPIFLTAIANRKHVYPISPQTILAAAALLCTASNRALDGALKSGGEPLPLIRTHTIKQARNLADTMYAAWQAQPGKDPA